jgi:hypothetical protein
MAETLLVWLLNSAERKKGKKNKKRKTDPIEESSEEKEKKPETKGKALMQVEERAVGSVEWGVCIPNTSGRWRNLGYSGDHRQVSWLVMESTSQLHYG